MPTITDRADVLSFRNGQKATLPFTTTEYESRLAKLRQIMDSHGINAALLTSIQNVAYYSGFVYCSFGRPYACLVTHDRCVTVSANIDGGQPWRRCHAENIVYTDWRRDNFWRAVRSIAADARCIGFEADHLTVAMNEQLAMHFANAKLLDISADTMAQRMLKSAEEIALISEGARIADMGGYAIREAIRPGAREIDLAMIGRQAMEREIAHAFPGSELRDSWVWFQSALNTDGAHNPITTRAIKHGDILSLNTFPMVCGYYTALERTLFIGEPDAASRRIWEANIRAHELGISLIKPGAVCSDICAQLNHFFAERDLLRYRSFGYGHSFGLLSHYYGREAGLELREDMDTVLQPGMVVSMEPMLTIPRTQPGAGGYREHDILVVGENQTTNITHFPYGPEHNIVCA